MRLAFVVVLGSAVWTLSSCSGSSGGSTALAELERALAEVRAFKNAIATEAGNDAIALRGFQIARPGDVWILDASDRSLRTRGSNVLDELLISGGVEMLDGASSLQLSLRWDRAYQDSAGIGIDVADLVVQSLLGRSEVQSVDLDISIEALTVRQLVNPTEVLDSYLIHAPRVRGNVLCTGTVSGRFRLKYTARNAQQERVEIAADVVAEDVNARVGGERIEAVSGQVEIVQQSPGEDTPIALTYFTVPEANQDVFWISSQLGQAACDGRESSLVIPRFLDNRLFAEFRIVKCWRGQSDIEWRIEVENKDELQRTISFTYSWVLDSYGASRGTERVVRLGPGMSQVDYLDVTANYSVNLIRPSLTLQSISFQ